jgi:hypothetical protein
MSRPKGQQASRTTPIPAKLVEYIEMCNFLPAPEELPGGIAGGPRDYWQDDSEIEQLKVQHPAFRKYLQGTDPDKDAVVIHRRCTRLKATRQVLRTIARWNREGLAGRLLPLMGELGDLVSVGTGPDGEKIEVKHSPLLEAIEGVEVFRIRECDGPACRRIFWAGRTDQSCCSSTCSSARRKQRYREKDYPEKYKLQRIQKAKATSKDEDKSLRDQRERERLRPLTAPTTAVRAARIPTYKRRTPDKNLRDDKKT